MPDHHDDIPLGDDTPFEDIPLEQLRIYLDDELIFDGSDPSTYIILDAGAMTNDEFWAALSSDGPPSSEKELDR
jgi:hypothetical protein